MLVPLLYSPDAGLQLNAPREFNYKKVSAATRGFDAAPWWSPSAALTPTRTARRRAALLLYRLAALLLCREETFFPGAALLCITFRAASYHILTAAARGVRHDLMKLSCCRI
jgi:hypothetical protein